MARLLTEIQEEILNTKKNTPELDELTSDSKVSIWRLFIYIVSYAIFSFELLLDKHQKEVSELLSEQKPHTARWYRNKALAFQYGFDLLEDSDKYNNEGYTDEQIQASKIVKYSAVTEATNESRLIIKIATEKNEELTPITDAQKEAFAAYMAEIKDAGVPITVINYLPDILQLIITIKRDPLVLDSNGYAIAPINGNIRPIDTAIKEFLRNLPFNGELVIDDLETYIRQAAGVLDISIDSANSAWIEGSSYGAYTGIYMSRIPESGYFTTKDTSGNELTNISYVV